jgi:hypothetical protein
VTEPAYNLTVEPKEALIEDDTWHVSELLSARSALVGSMLTMSDSLAR